MKIGGEYRLREIDIRDWQKLAKEPRVDPERTIERLQAMATRLPDGFRAVHARSVKEGLDKTIMNRLANVLSSGSKGGNAS
jgi:serine/threonine-protein kinase HipA